MSLKYNISKTMYPEIKKKRQPIEIPGSEDEKLIVLLYSDHQGHLYNEQKLI